MGHWGFDVDVRGNGEKIHLFTEVVYRPCVSRNGTDVIRLSQQVTVTLQHSTNSTNVRLILAQYTVCAISSRRPNGELLMDAAVCDHCQKERMRWWSGFLSAELTQFH